jgi:hypothetical protein
MSIDAAISSIEKIERNIGNVADLARVPALDLAQAVAHRVIEEGRDYEGAKFSPYSDEPLPAFFYFNRSANRAGEAKVRAAAKEKRGVSYRAFRAFNNRPTDIKNFSFTNQMWGGFGVVEVGGTGGLLTVTLGSKNPEAAKKIAHNSEREGKSIIRPSLEEIERFALAVAAKILSE